MRARSFDSRFRCFGADLSYPWPSQATVRFSPDSVTRDFRGFFGGGEREEGIFHAPAGPGKGAACLHPIDAATGNEHFRREIALRNSGYETRA